MAKECSVCGKSRKFGNKITFSHKKINRSWAPNLQKVRVNNDGTIKRVDVCTKCLKSGKVNKA